MSGGGAMMLQVGDEVTLYSVVFVAVLLGTRNPVWTTVLIASLYLFLAVFRFPQLSASRAWQVLHPARSTVGSGKVSVVAHRGGGHDAPENTIAAIREASKNGATGVELDVNFSADGVPILMHDDTVDRTTNGSGPLGQMRHSDLTKLDAAAKHRLWEKFTGEKIPTLEEAVKECIKLHLTIYFDVKGHPNERQQSLLQLLPESYPYPMVVMPLPPCSNMPEAVHLGDLLRIWAAAALKDLYKKYPVLYNSSIVCSFQPSVIYKMRQSDPEVVTALTHRPWSLSRFGDGTPRFSSSWKHFWLALNDVVLDFAHHNMLWKLCGNSAFLIQKNFVSQDYVQYWAQRGVEVVAWTVNTKVEKEYYHELLHVNYITDSLVEDCEPHY